MRKVSVERERNGAIFVEKKTLAEQFTGSRGRPGRYEAGMWAWLLHRITGWILAAYVLAHLWVIGFASFGSDPFNRIMSAFAHPVALAFDLVLLGVIVFHALNGLRVILFDLGVTVNQKALFWISLALAVIATGVSIPFFYGLW